MISSKIIISNNGTGMNEALDLTDSTAKTLGLARKEAFHLRLLAEEMMSMVRAITGNFSAEFWLENEGLDCKLHLSAKSEMDYKKRKEILSVSTSGKNAARRGIMEKIREILEAGLYGMDESFKLQAEYGTGIFAYGMMDGMDTGMSALMYSWSMQKYKSELADVKKDEPDAWDELEKSIIANIADEVQAGVSKDKVELVIHKNFSKK